MDIKKEFEKNYDIIVSDLQKLISIPSIAEDKPNGAYPFGKPVQDALEYMLSLGQSMGFSVKNVDNYGGHIDFPGSEKGIMAVVGHIDVVPEGEGWSHPPFSGEVVDGWMYGRGAQDDKGPTMICLYAMKILKDLGFKPKKTIRLILGLDEETNWDGMKYYLEKEETPDFGIVPDAIFPLVQCERGLLQFELKKKLQVKTYSEDQLILKEFSSGVAPNVIPGNSEFIIQGTPQTLSDLKTSLENNAKSKGYKCLATINSSELLVKTKGVSGHAAFPENATSAISIAMDLLGEIKFNNDEAASLISSYNNHIGFTMYGENIGCGFSDDLSGNLTFSIGNLYFNEKEINYVIDVRYPVTKTKEDVYLGLKDFIDQEGFELSELDHIHSIYQESDNPIVVSLLDIYRRITGDTDSKPYIMGGATFARAIPNCMAFGAIFPGDPETEHHKDERVELSQLFKAGLIYAESIFELASK